MVIIKRVIDAIDQFIGSAHIALVAGQVGNAVGVAHHLAAPNGNFASHPACERTATQGNLRINELDPVQTDVVRITTRGEEMQAHNKALWLEKNNIIRNQLIHGANVGCLWARRHRGRSLKLYHLAKLAPTVTRRFAEDKALDT